jgi:lysophospholipase L1-like esterase
MADYKQIRVRRDSFENFVTANLIYADGEPLHVIDAEHNDWLTGDGARDFNTLWADASSVANRAELSAGVAATAASAAAASATTASQIVSKGAALEAWFSALGNRAVAPARILAIGDSITEGSNATSLLRRWVQRLLSSIRARFPQVPAGGIGHLPPYYIGSSMGQPFSAVSSPPPGTDTTFGLGRRCAVMSGAQSYTYTITGTSFWLWYVSGPTTGNISVTIDGGAPFTITTAASPLADGKTWTSPVLSAGSHTVQVSVASGTIYFTGLSVFNGDENAGVQLFESGHWGWKTTDWANNSAYWPGVITPIQPQLVTIALMTNDYQAGVDPATCKANLLAMIAAVRSKCATPPSIVLVTYPARGDVSNPAHAWSEYVAVAASIATADAGVAHLDLSSRYASPATTNALGNWDGDKVHPTDKGHGLIAETVLAFVSPR